MKGILSSLPIALGFILTFSNLDCYAQNQSNTVNQSSQFTELLNAKRKINTQITVNDKYKIQVYNGDVENAKKIFSTVRTEFKQHDATVQFSTPTYKVLLGSFKTRIEGERVLTEIRRKYPNALLIKPVK